jgi:membrane protein
MTAIFDERDMAAHRERNNCAICIHAKRVVRAWLGCEPCATRTQTLHPVAVYGCSRYGYRSLGFALAEVVAFIRQLLRDHLAGRASLVAGSMAFFAILSIAPLLVVGVVMAGALVGARQARTELMGELGRSLGEAEAARIDALVQDVRTSTESWWFTVLSVVLVLYGATRLFVAIQHGLNQIWGVGPPSSAPRLSVRHRVSIMLRKRMLAFLMVLGAGLLIIAVVVVRLLLLDVIAWIERSPAAPVWGVVEPLGSFAIVTVIFAAIYKVLPDVHIAWRDVAIGAFVSALLFSLGLVALRFYLRAVAPSSTSGAAGSFAVLLIWLYYCAHIFLLGAQFTWQWANAYGRGVRHRHGSE